MDELSVSIITPSYNQASYIEATIQSVLNQQIPGLEYIVVDGGSSDDTIAILQKYQEQLRWSSQKDDGQAHAVNKGMTMTSGDIIGWLNSDDIYYPGAIEKIRRYFAAHPEVDVVYGDAWEVDCDGAIIKKYLTETWDLARLQVHCFISQPAAFFRRRILDRYGLLDTGLHFCMDYEYWLRLGMMGVSFSYIPEVFAGSRFYPGTKTCGFPLKATQEALNMLKNRIGYVPSRWLVNYAVLLVKNSTNQSSLNWRSKFAAWCIASYYGFKWNGFFRGIKTLINLPVAMIQMKLISQRWTFL